MYDVYEVDAGFGMLCDIVMSHGYNYEEEKE